MWKKILDWISILNEVERELNSKGIYHYYTLHGVYTAFVDNQSLTTQINSVNDKQDTIRKQNTRT